MQPRDLKASQFAEYPPEARKLAASHLEGLRRLPLSFVPSLLREVIEYDYKFPAERLAIDQELSDIDTLSPSQIEAWFGGFAQLSISPELERYDWVGEPAQFVERLSAYLWTTHQLDTFRAAATKYGERLQTVTKPQSMPTGRLGVAVIGQGVTSYDVPLFRNLRKHGTYFDNVVPGNGVDDLLKVAAARAKAHPVPYGHWYIDGGTAEEQGNSLTCVSYHGVGPVRDALLRDMQAEIKRPGMGPEELRTHLARLAPSDLGMNRLGDPVLDRFQIKLLTEGSGTQIFATTFVQWASRECLRRAQPLTLVARFAPRQRQRPMNELLSSSSGASELDPTGALVDADMAAYYHWINQQRLPGAEESSFLVWFEGHHEALAIAPTLPKGTKSSSRFDLSALTALITS